MLYSPYESSRLSDGATKLDLDTKTTSAYAGIEDIVREVCPH